MTSICVGGQPDPEDAEFVHNGIVYVTSGEMRTARLLDATGVPFTPNVRIVLGVVRNRRRQRESDHVVYVPDFLFNKEAWIWTDLDGTERLVHGIECKGATVKSRSKPRNTRKVKQLYEERGINLVMLCDAEIAEHERHGRFPLRPL